MIYYISATEESIRTTSDKKKKEPAEVNRFLGAEALLYRKLRKYTSKLKLLLVGGRASTRSAGKRKRAGEGDASQLLS